MKHSVESWIEVSSKDFVDFVMGNSLSPVRGYSTDEETVTYYGYDSGAELAEAQVFKSGKIHYRVCREQ